MSKVYVVVFETEGGADAMVYATKERAHQDFTDLDSDAPIASVKDEAHGFWTEVIE